MGNILQANFQTAGADYDPITRIYTDTVTIPLPGDPPGTGPVITSFQDDFTSDRQILLTPRIDQQDPLIPGTIRRFTDSTIIQTDTESGGSEQGLGASTLSTIAPTWVFDGVQIYLTNPEQGRANFGGRATEIFILQIVGDGVVVLGNNGSPAFVNLAGAIAGTSFEGPFEIINGTLAAPGIGVPIGNLSLDGTLNGATAVTQDFFVRISPIPTSVPAASNTANAQVFTQSVMALPPAGTPVTWKHYAPQTNFSNTQDIWSINDVVDGDFVRFGYTGGTGPRSSATVYAAIRANWVDAADGTNITDIRYVGLPARTRGFPSGGLSIGFGANTDVIEAPAAFANVNREAAISGTDFQGLLFEQSRATLQATTVAPLEAALVSPAGFMTNTAQENREQAILQTPRQLFAKSYEYFATNYNSPTINRPSLLTTTYNILLTEVSPVWTRDETYSRSRDVLLNGLSLGDVDLGADVSDPLNLYPTAKASWYNDNNDMAPSLAVSASSAGVPTLAGNWALTVDTGITSHRFREIRTGITGFTTGAVRMAAGGDTLSMDGTPMTIAFGRGIYDNVSGISNTATFSENPTIRLGGGAKNWDTQDVTGVGSLLPFGGDTVVINTTFNTVIPDALRAQVAATPNISFNDPVAPPAIRTFEVPADIREGYFAVRNITSDAVLVAPVLVNPGVAATYSVEISSNTYTLGDVIRIYWRPLARQSRAYNTTFLDYSESTAVVAGTVELTPQRIPAVLWEDVIGGLGTVGTTSSTVLLGLSDNAGVTRQELQFTDPTGTLGEPTNGFRATLLRSLLALNATNPGDDADAGINYFNGLVDNELNFDYISAGAGEVLVDGRYAYLESANLTTQVVVTSIINSSPVDTRSITPTSLLGVTGQTVIILPNPSGAGTGAISAAATLAINTNPRILNMENWTAYLTLTSTTGPFRYTATEYDPAVDYVALRQPVNL